MPPPEELRQIRRGLTGLGESEGARKFRRSELPKGVRPIDLHIRITNPLLQSSGWPIKRWPHWFPTGTMPPKPMEPPKTLTSGDRVKERPREFLMQVRIPKRRDRLAVPVHEIESDGSS